MPHSFSRNSDLNWNRLLYAGAGLVLLTGLVLHQGEVPDPGDHDKSLLYGTALRDPAPGKADQRNSEPAKSGQDCVADADADQAAGHSCSDSRGENRLAQNDPPK